MITSELFAPLTIERPGLIGSMYSLDIKKPFPFHRHQNASSRICLNLKTASPHLSRWICLNLNFLELLFTKSGGRRHFPLKRDLQPRKQMAPFHLGRIRFLRLFRDLLFFIESIFFTYQSLSRQSWKKISDSYLLGNQNFTPLYLCGLSSIKRVHGQKTLE